MTVTKKKLLIVEENQAFCELFRISLESNKDMIDIQVVHTVKDGLKKIYEYLPDLIVLDLVMVGYDGLFLLEALHNSPPPKVPKIILIIGDKQQQIAHYASEYGVGCCMTRSCLLEKFQYRVLLFLNSSVPYNVKRNSSFQLAGKRKNPEPLPEKANPSYTQRTRSKNITKLVLQLGIPTNILGYAYILDAVEYLISFSSSVPTMKQVYLEIASQYNTTSSCVESALRKTISKAHKTQNKSYCKLMEAYEIPIQEKPPSNGRFLTILAEEIRLGLTHFNV